MGASYWQRTADASGPAPSWAAPGPPPTEADVVIVGAGLAGLNTALALRARLPGARIVVLEATRVGHGASGRNAGFLSPLPAPVWLLGAATDPAQAWAARHLCAETGALARTIAADLPAAELAAADLHLRATGALSALGLDHFARALDRSGVAYQHAPGRADRRGGALVMPAAVVHPARLVRALAARAAAAGVAIHEGVAVVAIGPAPGGAVVRCAGAGPVRAAHVVLCSNGYSAGIDHGERLPALVVHSYMLATAPVPVAARAHLDHGAFTVEVNRDQAYHRVHDGRLLLGGMDKLRAAAGDDFDPAPAVRARLAALLAASYPDLVGADGGRALGLGPTGPGRAEAWGGRFHATATGLPIVRRGQRTPALVLNVGYGGTGVALSFTGARLAAALVAGDPRPHLSDDDARLLALLQRTRARTQAAHLARLAATTLTDALRRR